MAKHWLDGVERILNSNTGDLRRLAEVAGLDPTYLYENQDLSGCDLRGQDLRGMVLRGCNLEKAILDRATQIDEDFDPRIESGDNYWRFSISSELNTMVLHFMQYSRYVYAAWAYRNLIEHAFSAIHLGELDFYKKIVESNPNLSRAVKDYRKLNQINVKVLLYNSSKEEIEYELRRGLSEDDGRWFIVVGLLRHKIAFGDAKDYSNLSLNAFYPPKLIKIERSIS